MIKIGFLFGNETYFSNSVMEKIKSKNNSNIEVEPVVIGILNMVSKPKYSMIFDRFSNSMPFYKTALSFFEQSGVRVVNGSIKSAVDEEFLYSAVLKSRGINVPKTAIFPSKMLPNGVQGYDMRNLEYPLNWEKMFRKIGFPANIKANNANSIYDCYRIHSVQDFHFIYDMSDSNTLVLQQCIDTPNTYRIMVVGSSKYFLKYELNRSTKDRYSLPNNRPNAEQDKEIDSIIKRIRKVYPLDMFILDVAITDKTFVLNINPFSVNIDDIKLPENCYNWLVENTANLLIEIASTLPDIETITGASNQNIDAKLKKEKKNKQGRPKIADKAATTTNNDDNQSAAPARKRGRPRKYPIVVQ